MSQKISQKLSLYPIVDSLTWLMRMLNLDIKIIQLRIKNENLFRIEKIIQIAVLIGKKYNVKLFINDYWDLAIKFNAYGIHLGQEDINYANLKSIQNSGLQLGISAFNKLEVERALSYKPSYISLGNVFYTDTKTMFHPPQGLKKLKYLIEKIKHIPIVAIGGININNINSILNCKINYIAIISAITHAKNWHKETLILKIKINKRKNDNLLN